MKRSVRKSFKWLLVLGMIAGLLGALLPTGPAAAASLSFSTTKLPTAVNASVKGPSNDNGRNVLAVSPNYANDSRIWVALDDATKDADDIADEIAYSTNGGNSWSGAIDLGGSGDDPIVAIVPSPLFASDSTVFVATTTRIYRSTNGGSSYAQLGAEQDETNLRITSLAVAPNYNGVGEIAIGLVDMIAGTEACPDGPDDVDPGDELDDCVRVWGRADVLNWASPATNSMAADVTSIAYSPSFSADGVMMVIGSAPSDGDADDGTGHIKAGTGLYHVVGSNTEWISDATSTFGFVKISDAMDVGAVGDEGIISSALAVAPDYDGSDNAKRVVYVGTNSPALADEETGLGGDGIYRVAASTPGARRGPVADINVSNIAIAGTIGSPLVLFSAVDSLNGNAAYRTADFTSSSAPTFSTGRPVPGGAAGAASSSVVGLSPDGGTAFALVNSQFLRNAQNALVDEEGQTIAAGGMGILSPSGNGGFSRSADGGKTYAQVSLFNNIAAFTAPGMAAVEAADAVNGNPAVEAVAAMPGAAIAGFAVSPNFDTSGHMIAAAAGSRIGDNDTPDDATDDTDIGSDVIIYSANGGANWMVVDTRIFEETIEVLADEDGENAVSPVRPAVAFAYSPDFATDNTIYSADLNSSTLRRSTNGGLSWKNRSSVACPGSSTIDSIAAADQSTVFVGCSGSSFRKSVNGGFLFTAAGGTGSGAVSDIAMSPSYAEDNSILIGQKGEVRLSTNGGSSFSRLGSSGPGEGATQVAFHSDYATNSMVYAGSDKAYRWTVGTSTSWDDIAGATAVVGLGVGADGTLYVASGAPFAKAAAAKGDVDAVIADGGIFSSATPTASTVTVTQLGVPGTTGTNLKNDEMAGGFAHATTGGFERLWVSITNPGGDAADPKADNWRHYTDTIGSTMRPAGLTPADGAVVGRSNADGDGVVGFRIGWDAVAGATSYVYQWGTSSTFGSAACTSVASSALSVGSSSICDEQDARPGNTTYYWRVRVAAPVVGPYSAAQSLTTALIAGESAGLPTLSQPNAGNAADATSRAVPLQPLFVWTAVNNATNYELQVSTDGTFLDPNQMVVDRSGATRLGNQIAFQSSVQLAPSTVYFWRVRGVSATSQGGYPPAAAFTTTSSAAATGRLAAQALITLEATGNLEVVTGYDYASGLWQSYVPGLPGNSLVTIQPNSVLFITVMEDTTVVVSGVAYNIVADTPTPIPVGAAVTIAVQ